MGAKPKNRGGRPRIHAPKEGQRITISVRVTPRLKALIDEAAEGSGRSMSQEAEVIIERSFERRDTLRDVLELAYGPHLAGFLQVIGDAAFRTLAGSHALLYLQHNSDMANVAPFERALVEPWIFDQVARSTLAMIEHLRPPGSVEPPSDFEDVDYAKHVGERWANSLIKIMKEQQANSLEGMPAGPDDDRIQWAVESLADLLRLKEARK